MPKSKNNSKLLAKPKRKKNKAGNAVRSMVLAPSASMPGRKSPKSKGMGVPTLSKCALKYALACSNPFHPSSDTACIPIGGGPSAKVRGFTRFEATIGTAGVGFVAVSPSFASDVVQVFYTGSAFAGNSVAILSANNTFGTGIQTATVANLNYTQVLFQPAVGCQGRIVSAGLRAQYVGTVLNESGLFYCVTTQDHENAAALGGVATTTISSLSSLRTTDVSAVSRTPCSIVASCIDTSEQQYRSGSNQLVTFPFNGSGLTVFNGGFTLTNTAAPVMLIMFTGVPGQLIHFEYVVHAEIIGPNAAGASTDSEVDLAGVAMVDTAVSNIPTLKLAQPGKTPWEYLSMGLKAVYNAAKPYIVPALESAVMALLV